MGRECAGREGLSGKKKGGGGGTKRGKDGQRGVQQTERCMDTYTVTFVFVTVNNVFLFLTYFVILIIVRSVQYHLREKTLN